MIPITILKDSMKKYIPRVRSGACVPASYPLRDCGFPCFSRLSILSDMNPVQPALSVSQLLVEMETLPTL